MTDANHNQKSTCDDLPRVDVAQSGEHVTEIVTKCPGNDPAGATNGSPKNGNSKGGAPLGNQNGFRHGGRSARALGIGKLPPKARGSERRAQLFKKWLLAELTAAGLLSSAAEHLVQSAVLCEVRRLLVERWLRIDDEASPIESRLELLKAHDAALTARNKFIAQLGLSGSSDADADVYATLARHIAEQAPQKSAPASKPAPATKTTPKPAKRSRAFPNAPGAKSA